tara:strand:- start:1099 stop:1497 length:399 start_codon:yes stop_codon:yes gene_type:complete
MGFNYSTQDIAKKESSSYDEGIYDAEISDAEVKTSKATGNEYIGIRFKVVNEGGTLCYDNLHFTDKAKFFTGRKLKSLGIEPDEDFDAGDLIGKRVTLTLVKKADDPRYLEPDFKSDNYGYQADASEDDVPF